MAERMAHNGYGQYLLSILDEDRDSQ